MEKKNFFEAWYRTGNIEPYPLLRAQPRQYFGVLGKISQKHDFQKWSKTMLKMEVWYRTGNIEPYPLLRAQPRQYFGVLGKITKKWHKKKKLRCDTVREILNPTHFLAPSYVAVPEYWAPTHFLAHPMSQFRNIEHLPTS